MRALEASSNLFRARRKMRDPASRAEKPQPPRRHRACRQNRGTRVSGEGLARFRSVVAAIDALMASALLASSARHDAPWALGIVSKVAAAPVLSAVAFRREQRFNHRGRADSLLVDDLRRSQAARHANPEPMAARGWCFERSIFANARGRAQREGGKGGEACQRIDCVS
jgi:hypothetical protein